MEGRAFSSDAFPESSLLACGAPMPCGRCAGSSLTFCADLGSWRTEPRLHDGILIESGLKTGFYQFETGFSVSSTDIAVCPWIILTKTIYFVWDWC